MRDFKHKPKSNKILPTILSQIQKNEEIKYFVTGIEDGWIDGRGKNFERYLKIKRKYYEY